MHFLMILFSMLTAISIYAADDINPKVLAKNARARSVINFNMLSDYERTNLTQACRIHNRRFDDDIANLLASSKPPQKFQPDLIATFVTNDPFAQAKLK
jgi:hypothetical protein